MNGYDHWRNSGAWEDAPDPFEEDTCERCGRAGALDVRMHLNATSDGVLCDLCLEALREGGDDD